MNDSARDVIVGGGVLGCAVAYFLARTGPSEVLVLDQADDIATGTTRWGAGLIGQLRGTVASSRLIARTRQIVTDLCAEGLDPQWHPVGSLRIAHDPARKAEFSDLAATAAAAGIEACFLSSGEVRERFPGLELAGMSCALWCPSDGYVSAPALARAYAEAARRRGVRFAPGTRVLGFRAEGGRLVGIATNAGTVRCQRAVVAAGAMAARLAEKAGLTLPIFPVRHQSLVTGTVPGFHPSLPVLRAPDARFYLRPWGAAALLGAFTERALAHPVGQVGDPYPVAVQDSDELEWLLQEAARLVPALAETSVAEVRYGLPTCTPDGTTVLGAFPGVAGLYLLAACQAHGVAASAGLAALLVEALQSGRQPEVARGWEPARWVGRSWNEAEARCAAERFLQNYYTLPQPQQDPIR